MINAHKHRRKQYAMSKGFTQPFLRLKEQERAGFTIIEILTVLVIVVIIGYSISLLMTQVITSYTKIKAEQEIINSSRTIIRFLTQDLENTYISKLDNRFVFVGTSTTIDCTIFGETSVGDTNAVEVGFLRNANNELIRLFEENNIPNLVTSGGTSSIVAAGIQTLQFRFCYRNASGDFQYTSANWDSRVEHFSNYNHKGENKNPDGLPDAIEVSFSLQDSKGLYPVRNFVTKIYLPQDKY